MVLSAVLVAYVFSVLIEIVAGLSGTWPVPERSSELLKRTLSAAREQPSEDRLFGILDVLRINFAPVDIHQLPATNNPFVELLMRHLAATSNRIQIVTLRLASLVEFLPAMALIVASVFVDALVTRNLRSLRANRESGYVFHRLQRIRNTVLWLPIFLVLAAPVFVPPILMATIVLPAAAFIWIQAVLFAPHV